MRFNTKWPLIALLSLILTLSACQPASDNTGTEESTDTETTVTAPTESTTANTEEQVEPDEPEVVEKEITPQFGGTLNIATYAPDTLNPLYNDKQSVQQVLSLIYEPLFELDQTWKAEPVLVDAYNFEENGRVLKVSLKQDISFHDGSPLTADDVLYSIEMIEEADFTSYKNNVLAIKRITKEDDYNLTFYYDQGYAFALNDLTFPIVSSVYHESEGYDPLIPYGTGPYLFVDYQKMQHMDLTANTDWHNGDVYVKDIHNIIIDDSNSYETLFDQHLIDVMSPAKFNWLKYSENPDQRIENYVSNYYDFLAFNFDRAYFKDVNVRKAIAHAVDREYIVYDRFVGHGTIADTPVRPGSWFAPDSEDSAYPYEVSLAESLIAASLEDLDGDGFYDVKDAVDETQFTPIELDLLVNESNALRVETAQYIKANIEAIGLKVNIITATPQDYYEKVNKGDFDLLYGGWKLASKPDFTALFDTFGSQNFMGYSSEAMDNALENIIDAYTDDQISSSVEEFVQVMNNELPYVSLYFLDGALMSHSNVYGSFNAGTENTFRTIEDIYLDFTE